MSESINEPRFQVSPVAIIIGEIVRRVSVVRPYREYTLVTATRVKIVYCSTVLFYGSLEATEARCDPPQETIQNIQRNVTRNLTRGYNCRLL